MFFPRLFSNQYCCIMAIMKGLAFTCWTLNGIYANIDIKKGEREFSLPAVMSDSLSWHFHAQLVLLSSNIVSGRKETKGRGGWGGSYRPLTENWNCHLLLLLLSNLHARFRKKCFFAGPHFFFEDKYIFYWYCIDQLFLHYLNVQFPFDRPRLHPDFVDNYLIYSTDLKNSGSWVLSPGSAAVTHALLTDRSTAINEHQFVMVPKMHLSSERRRW